MGFSFLDLRYACAAVLALTGLLSGCSPQLINDEEVDSYEMGLASADVTGWSVSPGGGTRPINVRSVTLTGTHANVGATISVYTLATCATGGDVGSSTVATGGAISVTTASLSEGPSSFYYTLSNAAGGTHSCTTTGLSVTIDVTAPAAVTSITISPATSGATSVVAPTLSGTHAEDGVTVSAYTVSTCDTTAVGSATVTGGAFSIVSATLADGILPFYYGVADPAGNARACASTGFSYWLDATAPSAVTSWTINPANTANTTVDSPTLSGTAAENGAVVSAYTVSGCASGGIGSATVSSGAFTLASVRLYEGPYTFYYKIADTVGNATACAGTGLSLTIDTSAPSSISIVGTPSPYQSTAPITLTASESASLPMQMCYAESASCDPCNWTSFTNTATITLSSATHVKTISAKFKDSVGNTSGCVSNTVLGGALSVTGLYTVATKWNTYAKASDTTQACAGTEQGVNSCYHGGEAKAVNTGYTSCSGLTMSDSLDTFQWTCALDSTGYARFTSRMGYSRGLANLVNNLLWRDTSVTLLSSGTAVATSAASAWWNNTITALATSSTAAVTVSGPGSISVITGATTCGGVNIAADNVSLLVAPSGSLGWNPAAGTSNCTDGKCVIASSATKFIWIEGSLIGNASATDGLSMESVQFLQLRAVSSYGSTNGIKLNANNVTLDTVAAANNTSIGIYADGGYLLARKVRAYNNEKGVYAQGSNQVWIDVTANSGSTGFYDAGASNSVFNLTAINNDVAGIDWRGDLGILHNVFLANNVSGLVMGGASVSTSVAQIVSSNNDNNYVLQTTTASNKFTGLFGRGNSNIKDCSVTSTGANPGITDTSCITNGASDYTDNVVSDTTNSLVGKIIVDDTVNISDSNGSATASSITDWLGFSDISRVWGKDGSAYPNGDNRGRCTGATTCRIWSNRLLLSSSVIRGRTGNLTSDNDAFSSGAACPSQVNGNVGVTFLGGKSGLRNANEIPMDGFGDDDGICEGSERCFYLPNFGAYQGHGVTGTCEFSSSGGLTSISITGYSINGM